MISDYTAQIKEETQRNDAYPEISIIREKSADDERVYINMEFLGLDLSSIPSKDFADWKTYVIPVLYVISSFVSMKMTTAAQKKNKKEKSSELVENEEEEIDIMAQTNRNMTYMMPIIAISISLVAPLGLALYWLANNVLMMIERLILNKIFADKEELSNE